MIYENVVSLISEQPVLKLNSTNPINLLSLGMWKLFDVLNDSTKTLGMKLNGMAQGIEMGRVHISFHLIQDLEAGSRRANIH